VMGWKDENMYGVVSFLFAGTFLVTRVGGYTWGLWDLWVNGRDVWMTVATADTNNSWGAYYVVAAIHVGYGLNLFWGWKVVKALQRAVVQSSSSSSSSSSKGGDAVDNTETTTREKKSK